MQNKKGGAPMKQKWFSLFPLIALFVMLAVPQPVSAISEEDVKAMLNTMNDQLATAGEDFTLAYVDFLTVDEVGIRVYANNRQHRLDSHWMPYDPWRHGGREIYWIIDQADKTNDVPWPDVEAAIWRAMNIWDSQTCANIPLVQLDYPYDWGYVQYLVGMGGCACWMADITHAGWLPRVFFDIIGGPGGGDGILGATFTFVWTARPDDVAFREIYYNDKFPWAIDAHYDIETVVAHEVGHGLSLGHFGMIFRDAGTGHLQFAPRALMNAIYYSILHELLGTDVSSFCGIWSSWPNN
jgi:hypothetical protein